MSRLNPHRLAMRQVRTLLQGFPFHLSADAMRHEAEGSSGCWRWSPTAAVEQVEEGKNIRQLRRVQTEKLCAIAQLITHF